MALTFGTLLSSQRTNTHHHKPLRSGPLLWPAPGQLVQLTVLPVRRQLARRALHRARLMGHHEGLQLAGELRGRCPASPWLCTTLTTLRSNLVRCQSPHPDQPRVEQCGCLPHTRLPHSTAGAPNQARGLATGPRWLVTCTLEPVAQRLGATGSGLQ